jgi:MFS family permease
MGAAPMLPLSLALVCNVFPSEEQPRALGIWAAVSAIALAVGPLAGGLLIELDWRVIFWMNLPVLAAGFAITMAAAPESTDPGSGTRIDRTGCASRSSNSTSSATAPPGSRSSSAPSAPASPGAMCGMWRIRHPASHSTACTIGASIFRRA